MRKESARITSKWQITIPAAVRVRLGLRVGDVLEFLEEPGGVWRVRRRAEEGPFDRYVGLPKELAGHDPDELIREMRGRD